MHYYTAHQLKKLGNHHVEKKKKYKYYNNNENTRLRRFLPAADNTAGSLLEVIAEPILIIAARNECAVCARTCKIAGSYRLLVKEIKKFLTHVCSRKC